MENQPTRGETQSRPLITTVNTIRGGSGKTLFCILLALYLKGRVLLIDTDIQNSLSFWSHHV